MSEEDDLPDGAPSPEEASGAENRRRAVERGSDPVAELLSAAIRPRELADDVHERILARVLGEDVATELLPAVVEPEPSPREVRAAEELRRALEGSRDALEAHELGRLATALRAANDPAPLPEIRNEALLRSAIQSAGGRRSARALYAAATGILALAASFTLYLSGTNQDAAPRAPTAENVYVPGMAETRSTGPLFTVEDFPQGGGKTSERADKIAGARAADLRKNRYLSWGVE